MFMTMNVSRDNGYYRGKDDVPPFGEPFKTAPVREAYFLAICPSCKYPKSSPYATEAICKCIMREV